MTDEEIKALEAEFKNEQTGPGSYSPNITGGDEKKYVGFDIHPEDIESVFFGGIGVPRWETIQGDSPEEQEAAYGKLYTECMARFPMFARANDTYERADYTAEEVSKLIGECQTLLESADAKTGRAARKFLIAATRAQEAAAGLRLMPNFD
jgi:hypothetical protein